MLRASSLPLLQKGSLLNAARFSLNPDLQISGLFKDTESQDGKVMPRINRGRVNDDCLSQK